VNPGKQEGGEREKNKKVGESSFRGILQPTAVAAWVWHSSLGARACSLAPLPRPSFFSFLLIPIHVLVSTVLLLPPIIYIYIYIYGGGGGGGEPTSHSSSAPLLEAQRLRESEHVYTHNYIYLSISIER